MAMYTTTRRCLIFAALLIGIHVNGQIVVSSNTGIVQSCNNGQCRTCVNGNCYPRGFNSIKANGNCPAAACGNAQCKKYVIWTDGCPICSCPDGTGSQNPCNSQNECASGSKCTNYLCIIPKVPSNLPPACDFDYNCSKDQTCSGGVCTKGATRKHLENVSCVFTRDCPSGYECVTGAMTCYEQEGKVRGHVPGVTCVFRYQCPNGYYCDNMSCIQDYSGRQHIEGLACAVGCPQGYNCQGMTCIQN